MMYQYPPVLDPAKVGTYAALADAGGGYVWDSVLEYRVWCHPEAGAPDEADGDDYYYAFETYEDALAFSTLTIGAEEPLALIVQEEYIDEPEPGRYVHIKKRRIAEWPVSYLNRPKRTSQTIPEFLNPDTPRNRLDVLRGLTEQ